MADLVSVSELVAYLDGGIPPAVAETLLDAAEAQFEHECGRVQRPFQAAQAARVEVHDGIGLPDLWLDYPVATLTSVKIGTDPNAPDETLDVSDVDVIKVDARSPNRLVRTDGGTFGALGDRLVVQVTYNAAENLPTDARAAVLLMAVALYASKGNEGLKSERLGGYGVEYGLIDGAQLPAWRAAVEAHREVLL